ncbi:hypothetical protein A9K55_000747 [Cordyceps militaris]|uniref:Uncharacterized protein n=1 Tax=Cordyceps militaris TaxID=73501 RepID=A0A2H4STI1_CORMI|nr:hypothetical protein A9K55_000747 [Cordyceps militaris]
MARFSFAKGRKKAPPPPVLTEPMSKAHKILGSTPINIDFHKPWDDASSGYSGATANSTLSSYASSDDSCDQHVAVAHSEDKWANHSQVRPAALGSSTLDCERDNNFSGASRGLQRAQSASTLRPYDSTSKQPFPISQATSTSSMMKGVPSKIHKMLNPESPTVLKTKKKPPKLDLSNLRTSRLSRKTPQGLQHTDGTVMHDVENSTASPCASLVTPTGRRQNFQTRNTKDNMISADFEESKLSRLTGERRHGRPMKEVPSLYDHYEQMTKRQLRRETEMLEGEQQINQGFNEEAYIEYDEAPWTAQDSPWLQDILPPTPQTAFMTGLTPAASHNRSHSATSKMTSSTKRSKNLDDSVLQETSMLTLSESEEDDKPTPLPLSYTTSPSRHLSTGISRPQSSITSSRDSDHRLVRHSKKTSFAPVNTYITFSSSSTLNSDAAIPTEGESRSSTRYASIPANHRPSISNTSTSSAIRPSAIYIPEGRSVTMLAGRRPASVDNGEENTPHRPERVSSLKSLAPAARKALAPMPQELTPPLSPTSVDFFIRSARSSLDGSGSQKRYMAVTQEEEKLLSAFRNQKQPDKEPPSEVHQQPAHICSTDASTNANTTEGDETDSFPGMDCKSGEAKLDFGFPALPSARKRPCLEGTIDASASISSRASTATSDKLSQSSIAESESIDVAYKSSPAPSPVAQYPIERVLENHSVERQKPEQQEVILYLDEAEENRSMPDSSALACLIVPPLQKGNLRNSVHSYSPVHDTKQAQISSSPPPSTTPDSNLAEYVYRTSNTMPSVPEDSELEYKREGIHQPMGPSIPQTRTTLSSMPRLSAFGWWGDDD